MTEDDGDTLNTYDPLFQALKKATTINEIAAICKYMAWDLPSFISWFCNKVFDDYEDKNDFPAYGWDT